MCVGVIHGENLLGSTQTLVRSTCIKSLAVDESVYVNLCCRKVATVTTVFVYAFCDYVCQCPCVGPINHFGT